MKQIKSIKKFVEYVNKNLEKCSATGIYLPELTDAEITKLREYFEVRREFLGYVRFARKGDKR